MSFSFFSFYLLKSGDRDLDVSLSTINVSTDGDLTTIVDTLRYTFEPTDNGQLVRCVTAGSWLVVGQDQYDAFAQLDIMCKSVFKFVSFFSRIATTIVIGHSSVSSGSATIINNEFFFLLDNVILTLV